VFTTAELAQVTLGNVVLHSRYRNTEDEPNARIEGEVKNSSAYDLAALQIRVVITDPDSDAIAVDRRLPITYNPATSAGASGMLSVGLVLPNSVMQTLSKRKFWVEVVSAVSQ
jgi:hypothetical protein